MNERVLRSWKAPPKPRLDDGSGMILDGLLSVLAITQAIIATLRAGSRILLPDQEVSPTSSDPGLSWILRDLSSADNDANSSLGSLFDLTCGFRQAVNLGLRLGENFSVASQASNKKSSANADFRHQPYRIIDCTALIEYASDNPAKFNQNSGPYLMSLVPSPGKDEGAAVAFRLEDTTIVESEPTLAIEYRGGSYYSRAFVTECALSLQLKAKVTAYLPECFDDLRSECFGIDSKAFRETFLERPFASFQSNSKGAARIGGIFFVTHNHQYICKTIKRDELVTLLNMMPQYRQYMHEQGHTCLLTRVCGLYEIIMKNSSGDDFPPQYFVIMNSVFPKPAGADLFERFDLKGSTVGRRIKDEELVRLGGRSHVVLKDLNLMDDEPGIAVSTGTKADGTGIVENEFDNGSKHESSSLSTPLSNHGLHVGAETKESFMRQLRSDVQFLQQCDVIDYSLLVGVSSSILPRSKAARRKRRDKVLSFLLNRPIGTLSSSISSGGVDAGPYSAVKGTRYNKPVTYYFGIIDFLQPFNRKKQLEYCAKAIRYAGKATYSCVPPRLYGQRFIQFIDQHMS